VKNDDASENLVGRRFLDQLNCQRAVLSSKDAGWMNVDMANLNARDGIGKFHSVKLKPQLSSSYDTEAEYTQYNIMNFDIVFGGRSMCNIILP
jgi:hypothetical protein